MTELYVDPLEPVDQTNAQLAFENYIESDHGEHDFLDWLAEDLADELVDDLLPAALVLALRDHWKTTSSCERGLTHWLMQDEEDE